MEEAARKKTSILLEEPENRREPLLIAARDMANPRNMERKKKKPWLVVNVYIYLRYLGTSLSITATFGLWRERWFAMFA